MEIALLSTETLTMSSREIAELTVKRHDHVLRDTRAMLIGLYGESEVSEGLPEKDMFEVFCNRMGWGIDSPKLGDQRIDGVKVVRDSRGYVAEIQLDYNHTMTLIAGYNVKLRKTIIDRWQALEAKVQKPEISIPNFTNPAEAARAWALEYEKRLEVEKTKAWIGHRREATAMSTASHAVKRAKRLQVELDRSKEYATVKRMEMLYHGQRFNWRHLKTTAGEMGIEPIDVFDTNYGTVKSYHADVWREAYALEILEPCEAA